MFFVLPYFSDFQQNIKTSKSNRACFAVKNANLSLSLFKPIKTTVTLMHKAFFPKAKEIISSAFSVSRKTFVSKKKRQKKEMEKALAYAKTKNFCDYVHEKLKEASKQLPKINNENRFYVELMALIVDLGKVKECLAKANYSAEIVRKIRLEATEKIYKAKNTNEVAKAKKMAEARVCSVVKKLSPCLDFLRVEAKKLEELPEIDFNAKTVVLAGSPNVGKSTLLKRLTGASPEIAPYKFTTKSLNLGYYEWKYEKVQVIDTPGLLERSQHNKTELKTLNAIKRLSDLVLFVVDPSETCGEKIETQQALLNALTNIFKEKKFLAVLNKTDISTEEQIKVAKKLFERQKAILIKENEESMENLKQALWEETNPE